jgi:hypothetical protein
MGPALLTWISIGRGTMITGGGAVVAAGFERCPAPAGRQGQKKCREVSDPTFIKKIKKGALWRRSFSCPTARWLAG